MSAAGIFSAVVGLVYINLHPCSNDFRDKLGVLKLMVGVVRPYTIFQVMSYLRLLALSILACSPKMNSLARLVSDNFRSLEECGHRMFRVQNGIETLPKILTGCTNVTDRQARGGFAIVNTQT